MGVNSSGAGVNTVATKSPAPFFDTVPSPQNQYQLQNYQLAQRLQKDAAQSINTHLGRVHSSRVKAAI